jgi:hypothetical protein
MQGQAAESRVRHQHIAAAAQYKQRHVPLACPRARFGNLCFAGGFNKPPRRAPNSKGRQGGERNVLENLQKSRLQHRVKFVIAVCSVRALTAAPAAESPDMSIKRARRGSLARPEPVE